MGRWPKVVLGKVLQRSDETAMLKPEQDYYEITIRLWGKGVVARGKVRGSDVVTPRRFVRANQLVLSKIDARHGAIGLIPTELDGAIVSNDFPSFEIDKNFIEPAFLGWLVRSAQFVDLCKASSEGTTNRVRIKEDRFLNQKIAFPSLSEQQAIVACLDAVAEKARQVEVKLNEIELDAERLLAIRFREAVEGAEWRTMADLAPLVRREVNIDPEANYTELGIRSFYKGTFHRRTMSGAEYTWQNLYWVERGDLIFSNIMAWEQAIAVAADRDHNCVGNHRMLTCAVNPEISTPGFLWYYFTTADGFAKILSASPGTAARNKTLKADALMAIHVPVPKLAKQQAFDKLHAKIAEIKARHQETREFLKALLPSMLEQIFD
jgi:type I restriction enzyme S subunit